MRKQYHFRPSPNGYYAWDVDRLVSLTAGLKPQQVRLSDIAEIDEPYWSPVASEGLMSREIAEHSRLIHEADLGFPIILCSGGRIMDGMHRVLKALNLGLETIEACIFERDPEPDYVDVQPNELPYYTSTANGRARVINRRVTLIRQATTW